MIRRWLALTYYLYALRLSPPCLIFILIHYISWANCTSAAPKPDVYRPDVHCPIL